MTQLPPFTGDDPRCAKCGYEDARTTYRSFGCCTGDGIIMGYERNERLCRECFRCGYHWDEATVPAEPEPTGVR